jgi:Flp pilus assembly pilin Flp
MQMMHHIYHRIAPIRLAHHQPRAASGQGLVEYGLILVLVALAVIAALGLFGGSLAAVYTFILATLPF